MKEAKEKLICRIKSLNETKKKQTNIVFNFQSYYFYEYVHAFIDLGNEHDRLE